MAFTDYFENKLVDWLFRGQDFSIAGAEAPVGSGPTSFFLGLFTTSPTDSSAGVEVSGLGYHRVEMPCTLAYWSGTQGVGTLVASSGSTGTIVNNADLLFPSPTGPWGSVTAFGVFPSLTGGSLLMYTVMASSVLVNSGDSPPKFVLGGLSVKLDS